ncbi:hypothetical protein AMECASPLE_029963, partial [Ameca splendens]
IVEPARERNRVWREHSLPGSVKIQEGVCTTNGGLEQVSQRSHLEQVTGGSQSSYRKYFKKSFTAICKVFRAGQKITTKGKTLRQRSVGNPSSLCLPADESMRNTCRLRHSPAGGT